MTDLNRRRTLSNGFLAGVMGGIFMTLVMLILRYFTGASTLPEMISDRVAPFLPIPIFFKMLGLFGGYSHLKQFGIVSILVGMLVFAGIIGVLYAISMERSARAGRRLVGVAMAITWALSILLLWPMLAANYRGRPPGQATWFNAACLLLIYLVCGFVLMVVYRMLVGPSEATNPSGNSAGRRQVLPALLGVLGIGAILVMLRKFYEIAAYAYDGTEESGEDLPPITPNDDFYCVTKNNVDPQPAADLWRLEVTGMVNAPRVYRFDEIAALPSVEQETTLECISNQVGSGLMSNAIWRGVPLRDLIGAANPMPRIQQVVFHGADAYTDDLSFEMAMRPTTLVAYRMNGDPLALKHGFPARIIVPGMVGEKNVKWVTRIELLDHQTKQFYEKQGWGPSFRINTTSRFDSPDFDQPVKFARLITLRGTAFGGDRGVSRVEVSADDGATWHAAEITYKSSPLAWVQWRFDWSPAGPGEYPLVVRATDGNGEVQSGVDKPSGPEPATGYQRVTATLRS